MKTSIAKCIQAELRHYARHCNTSICMQMQTETCMLTAVPSPLEPVEAGIGLLFPVSTPSFGPIRKTDRKFYPERIMHFINKEEKRS